LQDKCPAGTLHEPTLSGSSRRQEACPELVEGAHSTPTRSPGKRSEPFDRLPGWLLVLVGGLVLGITGCVSQSTARREHLKAYEEGRQKALSEQATQNDPVVWFRGDIRNPRVPWREGLTLAEALLTAQYTWSWDPHLITVTRDGKVYPVNPKMLMRGTDNPVLEAGDIIEVHH
jgi:hypothetical protein